MRYVVTGGAGFIGSHLVERLVEDGGDVVVLDDFSTGKWENLQDLEEGVEVVEGSVTDPELCREVVDGAHYVFHQAALPSVPRSLRDPVSTTDVNVVGTLNVLMACQEGGVRRLVFAASSSAYGNVKELPKREDRPPLPESPYAASKVAGEAYLRAFHASFDLETVGLRYFNIFGPRQDPASQYAAVVPKFIAAALTGESPVIFGDGEQTRDFTYVANAVDANLLASQAPPKAVAGRVFNVGAGARISVNELWNRVRQATGGSVEAQYTAARPGDVRDSLASLASAREALGYTPRVDVDEGLERTVAFFREPLESAS